MIEKLKTMIEMAREKLTNALKVATCQTAMYGSLSLAYFGSGAHLIDKDLIVFIAAGIYAVLAARH